MPTRNTRPSPEMIQPEVWLSQAPQPAHRAASAAKRQRRAEHRVPARPFKFLSPTACPTIRQIILVQALAVRAQRAERPRRSSVPYQVRAELWAFLQRSIRIFRRSDAVALILSSRDEYQSG